mgnify:CR=1 FL=1|tara:strand:+ start:99 stop:506 length:408 start_codon:yes stop_codon:yes gene_type:complete
MKLIPKSKNEIIKEKVTLYKNCLKAGLSHVGDNVYSDGKEYFRFGFIRSVKEIKKIVKDRHDGDKGHYAVQMHDFEMMIPREVLSALVNRKVKSVMKQRLENELSNLGLDTDTPENIFDSERDSIPDVYDLSYYG